MVGGRPGYEEEEEGAKFEITRRRRRRHRACREKGKGREGGMSGTSRGIGGANCMHGEGVASKVPSWLLILLKYAE